MKVKFANRIYEVLFTKELAGLTMYAVEDEPNHIDWLINVEVIDAEKKELKKIEEEFNGEDYGIDSLWHAQNILESTLNKVEGYQSDDGILEHKCAITAVKKLYKQKPAWSKEDERMFKSALWHVKNSCGNGGKNSGEFEVYNWLKSLKDRVQPKQEWSEDDEKEVAVLEAYIRSKDWSERHIDRALGIVDELVNKVKSLRPQNTWKPSDEQMYNLSEAAHYRTEFWDCDILIGLYDELKKLKG